MIQALNLTNFQSHANTDLKLPEGMIVIHGPSDNGKSSIIRGIRWVVLNRPNGDDFRRHETDKTSVTLESDNFIVHRRRTDKKNEYEMNEETYKALRTSVPEDISTALNLSEANIQSQHEVYFLVDKSPGQRSKILNEVAGLQIMDKVLKKVNSEVRSVNSDIKAINKQLVEDQNAIFDLDWVKDADKFLKKLEEFQDKLEQLEEEHDEITAILWQLQQLEEQKDKFISDECIVKIDVLLKKNSAIEKEYKRYLSIIGIVNKIDKLQEQLDSIAVIDVTELRKRQNMIDSEQEKYETVSEIIEDIQNFKTKYSEVELQLAETEKLIAAELKRLGVCPTCGVKI